MEPVVGISGCLMGQTVRFDGGHKRLSFATDQLGPHVRFRPVCPEMAAGLGSPRPAIRQLATADGIRLRHSHGEPIDVTDALAEASDRIVDHCGDLSGFIVCHNSPTCGMERVKVYGDSGMAAKDGVGLFTARLMARYPWLPVEESGRLNDPLLRENFVMRVFALARWRLLTSQMSLPRAMVVFHSSYKLVLMAQAPAAYRALGPLVAEAGRAASEPALADRYLELMMAALKQIAGRGHHANVLAHIQGYFKRDLAAEDRQELAAAIAEYRQGLLPLLAPLTLIRHHLRRHPKPYLSSQAYLDPYPADMRLRQPL